MAHSLTEQFASLLIQEAQAVAELVKASGPTPPPATPAHTEAILNWIATVALLAEGVERGAHNGCTFSKRVAAAKRIIQAWRSMQEPR